MHRNLEKMVLANLPQKKSHRLDSVKQLSHGYNAKYLTPMRFPCNLLCNNNQSRYFKKTETSAA